MRSKVEARSVSARTRGTARAGPLLHAGARPRSRRRVHVVRSIAFVLIDIIGWTFALACALLLRYDFDLSDIDSRALLTVVSTVAVAQLACGVLIQYYRPRPIGSFDDVADVARSMLVVGVLLFGTNLLASPLIVPRTVPLIALPIAILAAVGLRGSIRSARAHSLRRSNRSSRADLLLVIGRPPLSVDRSVVDAAAHAGLQVVHVAPLDDILASAVMEDDLAADSAVAGHRRFRTRQRGKRTMDLLLCVLALPLVLSVCLLVAIVLAVGQRQVLYRAQRVGRNGRPFTMLKFATMRPGDAGPRVTRERDPRITPIGRWLRATKLNELPQVFNVIKGDMSIVGPRPEDPRYVAFFTPEQTEVLQVRPGLVSPAYLVFGDEQTFIECADPADIEAYYVRELLPEKLRIELQYLQVWSIAGDLRIIARTAARLINCSGGSHG
jgi:lipopolysaccharide/colanic/teichoic acid biosynthesis glycosyltransferase